MAKPPEGNLILPVVMCGGAGTRLWPLSTDSAPKQFHALAGARSLLQDTVDRVRGGLFLPPLMVCSDRHAEEVRRQLAEIDVEPLALVLEPMARSTGPVAVIAALWAQAHAPGASILLLPADHIVADQNGFRSAIETAAAFSRDSIIALGIEPTGPETGFGYIKGGSEVTPGVFSVERFLEKPAKAVAERLIAEGGYTWNAGVFVFSPEFIIEEAREYAPNLLSGATSTYAKSSRRGADVLLDIESFAATPSVSIDVAILERTARASVIPCSIGWADVGSWSELWSQGEKGEDQNYNRGDVEVLDSSGCLLWSNGPSISAIGVSDLIVVATADHILVAPRSRAQDVKRIVEQRNRRS